jgi:hypothetical protein
METDHICKCGHKKYKEENSSDNGEDSIEILRCEYCNQLWIRQNHSKWSPYIEQSLDNPEEKTIFEKVKIFLKNSLTNDS